MLLIKVLLFVNVNKAEGPQRDSILSENSIGFDCSGYEIIKLRAEYAGTRQGTIDREPSQMMPR